MSITFYGLTHGAYQKVDRLLTHEGIRFKAEDDDFDGLYNIEIKDHQNYKQLTVLMQGHDVVVHGKESRTRFDISECEKVVTL